MREAREAVRDRDLTEIKATYKRMHLEVRSFTQEIHLIQKLKNCL